MSVSCINFWSKKSKIFFTGLMGSGKTEIAINYAKGWSGALQDQVSLIDLDMVKPNFRLRSVSDFGNLGKVDIIFPQGPYGYADFPIIDAKMESAILNPKSYTVIDLGGGEAGARIAGRYRGKMDLQRTDCFFVYNQKRPYGKNEKSLDEEVYSLQKVSGLTITGIIHNTHLMWDTTLETLMDAQESAYALAKRFQVPLVFSCIREDLYSEASKRIKENLFPLKLYLTPEWIDFQASAI